MEGNVEGSLSVKTEKMPILPLEQREVVVLLSAR